MLLNRQYPCREVHAPHIRGTEELPVLREREDGGDRFRLSDIDLHMPAHEGICDGVFPESVPHDSGRIRPYDQPPTHEHGSCR